MLDGGALDGGSDGGSDDAGDPGFSIPPRDWRDAGGFNAIGCRDDDSHAILVFNSMTAADPWCAAVDLRAGDAGLFGETFQAPTGLTVFDARYSYDCGSLVITGNRLNTSLRPLHGLEGGMELAAFVNGVPEAFQGQFRLRIEANVYGDEGLFSMQSPCSPGFPR